MTLRTKTTPTILTSAEIDDYRSNWWIRSNKIGSDTMPIRHKSDFKQALCTLQQLKEKEAQRNQRWHTVHLLRGGVGTSLGGLLISMKVTMEMNQVLIEQSNLFFKWLEQYFQGMIFLEFIYFLTVGSFTADSGSTVTDGECKLHASNAAGIRCKTCEKMATSISGKNYYSMTTMRIGYEKTDRKVELCTSGEHSTIRTSIDNMYACVTRHCTDVNDDMHACVTPHDATLHWTHPLSAMHSSQIVILISSTQLAQDLSLAFSYHPHGHPRACGLLALTFYFYFPLFQPSLFFFLFLFLTNKKFMANLYNSAKEKCTHQWRPLLPHRLWAQSQRYPGLTKLQSYTTPTADPDYDDATLEDMLLSSASSASLSLSYEKICLSICRPSSMSDGTGQTVGVGQEHPGEHESSEAQIRTLLGEKKQKVLAKCHARVSHHEISSNSSRRRATTSSRTTIAAQFGISWISSKKSHWNGRIKEVSEFYIRHCGKTKAH